MSEEAFSKVMRGLGEAKAYIEGEREGYEVTFPACGVVAPGVDKTGDSR